MHIENVKDFNEALENGPYAWPGMYPVYFICADNEALSFEAALEHADLIHEAIAEKDNTGGWRVVAVCINWEDKDLICAHTGKQIAPAYGAD